MYFIYPDEILRSMERSNHNGYSGHQVSRSKPIPPPKPPAVKHQFDSLEQYLLREGKQLIVVLDLCNIITCVGKTNCGGLGHALIV